jgi:Helix-turn-helix domain
MSHFSIDHHIVDVLMPDLVGHDRSPSAFLVYLYLWRMAGGRGRVQVSYTTMAADTGLSKTSAQRAVALLQRRKLIAMNKAKATDIPEYRIEKSWGR